MDRVAAYRQIIEQTLTDYAKLPYAYGDIQRKTVFNQETDTYLLLSVGWLNHKRIHTCLIHLDIIDGKVWVQRDGTEEGIAADLMRAGIPKEHIVLAFHEPSLRPYTGFAVA
jgi:hypothetical protein